MYQEWVIQDYTIHDTLGKAERETTYASCQIVVLHEKLVAIETFSDAFQIFSHKER